MKFVLRCRPVKWFIRKDWYGIRHTDYMGEEYFLVDIGAVTAGVVRSNKACSGRFATWLFGKLNSLGLRR